MRCGDHVHHKPSGEDWVVAYVDGDYLCACGWPESEAKVADCALIKEASDGEHIDWLRRCAQSDGKRARMARAALETMSEPMPDLGDSRRGRPAPGQAPFELGAILGDALRKAREL